MPKIISKDITQVIVNKREVKLDKPIHVGFTVLELSKLIMAKFWYNVMIPLFGEERTKLLYSGKVFIISTV
jgi:hypothetical protein